MFRYTKWTFLREISVWVYALIVLSPLYILINVALKGPEEVHGVPGYVPVVKPSLESFGLVIFGEKGPALFGGLLTSVIITTIAVTGLIFFGSVTSYILARRMSKLSKTAYYLVLTAIVVPAQLGLVPVYIGAKALGLLGTPWGMGIIYIGMLMPLSIMLYTGFIRTLPHEYEEAAYIDGSSRFRTFTQIVFPLLSPVTGTVAIMAGIIVWNDFFTPLIFMAGSDSPTLGLVIYNFVGGIVTEWNQVFAILIIAMLPMTILYLVFQKKFIQGFSGGIKS
jgi:raffinose/stachyose/melibiose transport system permease protein